jgi:hypothetical protein
MTFCACSSPPSAASVSRISDADERRAMARPIAPAGAAPARRP